MTLDLYLFQEIDILNPCFIFSKRKKVITRAKSYLKLLIWNAAAVVCIADTSLTDESASSSPGILGIVGISEILHSLDQNESSSFKQLINGKSRDLQKLLKYFNGTTTSASNVLLSSGVLPINFALYSFFYCYLSYY